MWLIQRKLFARHFEKLVSGSGESSEVHSGSAPGAIPSPLYGRFSVKLPASGYSERSATCWPFAAAASGPESWKPGSVSTWQSVQRWSL